MHNPSTADSSSNMHGKITWQGFAKGAKHILLVSQTIRDGWQLRGSLDEDCGGYLARRIDSLVRAASFSATGEVPSPSASAISSMNDEDEEEDPSRLNLLIPVPEDLNDRTQLVFKEFHVIYNVAHEVPTVFFKVMTEGGSSLPIEYLWKEFICKQNLDPSYMDRLRTLTQQEHPFLGDPWYYLHPCNTSNLMGQIPATLDDENHKDKRYLVGWMSTVLPLLGCPVSHLYVV